MVFMKKQDYETPNCFLVLYEEEDIVRTSTTDINAGDLKDWWE